MKRRVAHVIVLVVISLIFTSVCEAATDTRFEGLWKQKDIRDYLLKGKIVMFAGTRHFETRVIGTRVVAYSENGRAVSTDKAVTVDSLFALANKRPATNDYVDVRRVDEEYGIPEWIGYGRKGVTDTGGYIEVTDFIPHPESFRPAATTYQGNYIVEDFDGLRLLLRKGDQVFVQSVADRQLVPVTTGLVPGGRVKLAWPYVLWSNLLQKNYFISAKNLESGKIKTLTDEDREDSFSFLIENRWVAWLNSKTQGYNTLNLLDLEAGSNTVISKVPFISAGNEVLLKNGRLFWIDGREIKFFQPQQGVRKLTLEPFLDTLQSSWAG